ncbi:XRE family transcriptional regulator [Actinomadura sp. KC216]|uniref:helix-turn-helix domain-containing protein n=1 Tax=Actinomadura sp. KC216 TaxID=2530370 RepID=UPI0010499D0E|nr:XRE family transcriptional regulator [Actinomadura sp. KC216]TDB91945.1 XRE family transcriptional regulator [Actinomadura sp. KC216]
MEGSTPITETLDGVGPRLKRLRAERNVTLATLSAVTGISKSALSRLETGQRRPSLELLLPIAQAYQVPLDELIGSTEVGAPRVRARPLRVHDKIVLPLTRQAGPLQAFKIVVPAVRAKPELCTHEGYEWMYVLSGRLRLVLGEQDMMLGPGEVAEFDTLVPHWFGTLGEGAAEILSLFGRQGERVHVRVKPRRRAANAR